MPLFFLERSAGAKPRPNNEWKDSTKNCWRRRPLPSSPCKTHGAVRPKTNSFLLAISKIGCSGSCNLYFDQKASRIKNSRSASGLTSPVTKCQALICRRNPIQSRKRSIGGLHGPLVSSFVFGIGKPRPHCSTNTRCVSLSEFCSFTLANSRSPPTFLAASWPMSLTVSRAVLIADVQLASATSKRSPTKILGELKLLWQELLVIASVCKFICN